MSETHSTTNNGEGVMPSWRVIEGDCRDVLRTLPACSVQTCVTSPPYFGLRDYGTGEWVGGENTCDHLAPPGGGVDATGLMRDGRSEGTRQGGAERVVRDRRQQFRDVCGKCGATRGDRQIGLEQTPDEFVVALVAVFREVRRVLRDDGTVWLNLGDSYSGAPVGSFNGGGFKDKSAQTGGRDLSGHAQAGPANKANLPGIKQKDLIGIPWMVAFALRADDWYLRSEIIWAKRNCMPESVTDRPTKAHEQIFLLSKQPRYFYDAHAVREQSDPDQAAHDQRYAKVYDGPGTDPANGQPGNVNNGGIHSRAATDGKANKRSVWRVASTPFAGAHFATFPPKLIEPCILAGSAPKCCGECGAPWQRVVKRTPMVVTPTPKRAEWQATDDHARTQVGGTMTEPPTSRTVGWKPTCDHGDDTGHSMVLDPFAGSGTTGMVALRHGRSFVGVELNPEYAEMARRRICDDAPLLNTPAEIAA